MVFQKFTISAYLLQIARQLLTARAFLAHSTDWLKQTTTFVKFKLFQDQRFQNHFSSELGNVQGLILYGHQPVEDNLVYDNQQK